MKTNEECIEWFIANIEPFTKKEDWEITWKNVTRDNKTFRYFKHLIKNKHGWYTIRCIKEEDDKLSCEAMSGYEGKK